MSTRRFVRLFPLLVVAGFVPFVDVLFAAPQERKPRKVAFLVGVGKFKHLPDLKGAPQRDVDALEGVLRGHGFEVVKLTDAQAGKDDVEGRFKKLLAGDGDRKNALGQGDVLLVAVCSHGFTLELTDPATKVKRTEPFVAGYDAVANKPEDMIALNGLIDAAKDYGAAKLFLVDACREETVDPDRGITRNIGIGGTRVELPQNTAVLFSCKKGQLSHQPEELKHGLFTFAVLRALKGESGLSGEVTWSDLVSNVGKSFRSKEFTKHVGGREQTPVFASGEGGDVTLLTLRPATVPAPKVDPPGGGVMAKKDVLPNEREEPFDYIVNDTESKKGTRRVLTLDLGGGVTMDVVRITASEFLMGALDGEKQASYTEMPQRKVTLTKDFYLGKHEVTQAQYEAILGMAKNQSRFKGKQLPVETVSWDEATDFCKLLGEKVKKKVELPSEAQWEFACRAGTKTPFHFGSKLDEKRANNDLGTTVAVGSYKPNGFGLHDMHGNVWEWCQDYYGLYGSVEMKKADPIQLNKQFEERRVFRGGSWLDNTSECRAANRSSNAPDYRSSFNGFRVCVRLD